MSGGRMSAASLPPSLPPPSFINASPIAVSAPSALPPSLLTLILKGAEHANCMSMEREEEMERRMEGSAKGRSVVACLRPAACLLGWLSSSSLSPSLHPSRLPRAIAKTSNATTILYRGRPSISSSFSSFPPLLLLRAAAATAGTQGVPPPSLPLWSWMWPCSSLELWCWDGEIERRWNCLRLS